MRRRRHIEPARAAPPRGWRRLAAWCGLWALLLHLAVMAVHVPPALAAAPDHDHALAHCHDPAPEAPRHDAAHDLPPCALCASLQIGKALPAAEPAPLPRPAMRRLDRAAAEAARGRAADRPRPFQARAPPDIV